MTASASCCLEDLMVAVVDDLVEEIDPDSERWPDRASLQPLQHELEMILEGAIADWRLTMKQEVKG